MGGHEGPGLRGFSIRPHIQISSPLDCMPSPSLTGFEQKVVIGIADMAVTNNVNATLTTYSLGSCLGVTIYDPVVKVGGMIHIMLPDSSIDPAKAQSVPSMFVDSGIPALFRSAYRLGAEKYRLVINMAGGAQIMDAAGYFNIGKRNLEALTRLLGRHSLKIHNQAVGGLVNRTMYFNIATGEVRLKVSGDTRIHVLCQRLTTI